MQRDFFHSVSFSTQLFFSHFPPLSLFPFLFPICLYLFCAHCSAAIPLYFPLFLPLYPFPLSLFIFLLLYSVSSAALPPIPSFQLPSPHTCQVVLLFFCCSYPVIALFVFKFTFHGYAQQNSWKPPCLLHKESEDINQLNIYSYREGLVSHQPCKNYW